MVFVLFKEISKIRDGQKMELNRELLMWIKSTAIRFLATKPHQGRVFIMLCSTASFVNGFQNLKKIVVLALKLRLRTEYERKAVKE